MGDYKEKFCGSTNSLHIAEIFSITSPAGAICRTGQHCVSMYMASSEGRLGLAAGRVLWHTYQVEEWERMLRVRYVRASRLCYGKP